MNEIVNTQNQPGEGKPSKIRILVADDEKFARKIIRQLLVETKYEISFVESGEEAINTLQNDVVFDVVILDLLMAGIDGYETLICLKQEKLTSHLPVIIITALNDDEEKEKAISLGAAVYLIKPIQAQQLINAIDICIQAE